MVTHGDPVMAMAMVLKEIQRHQPDVLGLCEVDRFDDFATDLASDGYEGTFKRKRHLAAF